MFNGCHEKFLLCNNNEIYAYCYYKDSILVDSSILQKNDGIKDIFSGSNRSFILCNNGVMFAVGQYGNNDAFFNPISMDGINKAGGVDAVYPGEKNTFLITKNKTVFVYGDDFTMSTQHEHIPDYYKFIPIEDKDDLIKKAGGASKIYVGESQTYLECEDGTLLVCHGIEDLTANLAKIKEDRCFKPYASSLKSLVELAEIRELCDEFEVIEVIERKPKERCSIQ